MKQTVYADVLLALNFFINYFLLLSVGRIMKSSISRTRICLGAAFGAACSLTLFLPPLPFVLGCLIKLIISSGMIRISFRLKNLHDFWHCLLVTCAVTFGFGGVIMGPIAFIEFIIYLTKSDAEFEETYVRGHKGWF